MNNFTTITKYMCTVETKNYPVVTITPNIQRYASIRKKLNASEIASCIGAYAIVTLHKNNGANVRLTKDNFKRVLLEYKNELLVQETKQTSYDESKKNAEDIEKMKSETPVITNTIENNITIAETESLEELQSDPEDPDTFDYSYIDSEEGNTSEE